jgi:hypothetical protein
VTKYSLAVKENKGPFFRLRHDCEKGHHTQHLSKHMRTQLCSELTSVTRESSVKCVETKHANDENVCHPSSMLEMQRQGSLSSVCNVLNLGSACYH